MEDYRFVINEKRKSLNAVYKLSANAPLHITVPDGVKIINPYAFNNILVETINLPDSVEVIEDFAFINQTSLESIALSDSIKYIGSSAFENCSKLKSIYLPTNIEEINEFAFSGCSNLTAYLYTNSISSSVKICKGAFDANSRIIFIR